MSSWAVSKSSTNCLDRLVNYTYTAYTALYTLLWMRTSSLNKKGTKTQRKEPSTPQKAGAFWQTGDATPIDTVAHSLMKIPHTFQALESSFLGLKKLECFNLKSIVSRKLLWPHVIMSFLKQQNEEPGRLHVRSDQKYLDRISNGSPRLRWSPQQLTVVGYMEI